MRALLQRVKEAHVEIDHRIRGAIDRGLLVFLGLKKGDEKRDAEYLIDKIVHLRIFEDQSHKMNQSIIDIKGEILLVSQFTLYADSRKGRRPGFNQAMPSDEAKTLYNFFLEGISSYGLKVSSGEFQAMMNVALVNEGPVTLLLESDRL